MILCLKGSLKATDSVTQSITLLGQHLKQKGKDFSTGNLNDLEIYIDNEKILATINDMPLDTFSTIYIRQSGSYDLEAALIAYYGKQKGILCIDHYHENNRHTNKLFQMLKFAFHNLSVPKTYFSSNYSETKLNKVIQFLAFPIIIKQCGRSKGQGVDIAENIHELQEKIQNFKRTFPTQLIFLQEFIPNSFEYRVFITGNTVATIEKKERQTDKFRNNVCLGAKETFISIAEAPKNVCDTAITAAKLIDVQVAGVDIVEVNKLPIIFEVNPAPGFTLDETVSDEIKLLSEYLILCEKR